jgi:hypothetical protein
MKSSFSDSMASMSYSTLSLSLTSELSTDEDASLSTGVGNRCSWSVVLGDSTVQRFSVM